MIFKQYYLQSLSQASYLLGDEESLVAAIVDPQRDIDHYLLDLDHQHLTLHYIILTHVHADFVAGHLELHRATGAGIYLGSRATAHFPFHPMPHAYEIEFGATRLTILETPGHTPESISIVIYDRHEDSARPKAILTGDTLFVGDVGRPDLLASFGADSQTLAGQLYDSLHHRLLSQLPQTRIYPGHGAGSLCGKHLSSQLSSTLEQERQTNEALKPMSKQAFIDLVTTDQLEAPSYFSQVAFMNCQDRPTLEEVLAQSCQPLTLEQVLHEKSVGTQVLDVRASDDFAAGHLCESLHIGLSGKFETWAGSILDREIPIVVIAEPGQEREAMIRLARVGLDHPKGYLNFGMQALASTPELIRHTDRMAVTDLQKRLAKDDCPYLIDVRSPQEWQAGHIHESRNIPLPHLTSRLSEVPCHHPIVVYCSSGYRSSLAASLLEHRHYSNIIELTGGYEAWEMAVVHPSLHSASALQQPGGRQPKLKDT